MPLSLFHGTKTHRKALDRQIVQHHMILISLFTRRLDKYYGFRAMVETTLSTSKAALSHMTNVYRGINNCMHIYMQFYY